MSVRNVELLAPAGNREALVGALNAGADAVYLGGDKFSARAYADNFTREGLLKALHYTHICGKKLYLTLNTLIKEKELPGLYDYLRPLYEEGLDAVIIQDLGVLSFVKEVFPKLPVHASTQMTVTGTRGAVFLKKAGVSRLIPARELSLEEIKAVKAESGLEMECFIHGAMCYSYSGQCLFSSILGGRSGNRGRCAQPCRLPYKISEKKTGADCGEFYPLSLKDMCTLKYIPKLIEAGIDSFKIEGRRKKPEYAAGVSALYRKYIDMYFEKGAAAYNIDEDDMRKLRGLYLRSGVQTGYYEKYNGREMITIDKGGYMGSDKALLNEISEKYLKEEKKLPVSIRGGFEAGKEAFLTIEGRGLSVSVKGAEVLSAERAPMSEETVLKQLLKTGNASVRAAAADISVGENIFIPVSRLNELRRTAVMAFEDELIKKNGFSPREKMPPNLQAYYASEENAHMQGGSDIEKSDEKPIIRAGIKKEPQPGPRLHVSARNIAQLRALSRYSCDRIYIDGDCYLREFDQISQYMEKHKETAIFLSLPFVIRERDEAYLRELEGLMDERIKGFLVRSLDELDWALSLGGRYVIVCDSNLYCFNSRSYDFLRRFSSEVYLPWELNGAECRALIKGRDKLSLPVYGRIPMMISANCAAKSAGLCQNAETLEKTVYLTDRYDAVFPVLCSCTHCCNVIYNSLPYSLHREWNRIRTLGLFAVRLDFIFEKEDELAEIMDFYAGRGAFPVFKYTSGHYKRGVE